MKRTIAAFFADRSIGMRLTQYPGRVSFVTMVLVFVLVAIYRLLHIGPNELSWDVFGYYIHLPATFVHGDPLLRDISWLHELLAEKPEVSGTLFQVTQAPDGSPMYFFLMGMSLLYLPFFLLAHAIAALTGHPMDGFSQPYQVTMAIGALVYTWIGLVHLRRILLAFFTDRTVAWVILLVTMGTNWFHFMTVKNLETANFLFVLMSVLVWNTMQWHRTERLRNILWVAVSLALITLVKPSEVLAIMIPLFWGVYDRASWAAQWDRAVRRRTQVFKAMGAGLLVVLPQMLYWWKLTGSPVFDSYQNPGVGLDLWQPHVADALFSFKKGWLLYTPVMFFALVGFFHLRKRRPELFPVILGSFLISLWIICSWTEWWYGASFSVRPMITTYVLLAIPLGFCVEAIGRARPIVRGALIGLQTLLLALNLFQTWQHHHDILDPYRTTKAYYFAIFGRTSVPPGAEWLKSVERSFDGSYSFTNPEHYRRLNIGHYDFEEKDLEHPDHYSNDTLLRSQVYRLDGDVQFSPSIRNSYGALTDRDHLRVKARVRMFVPEDFEGEGPCLVFTMERKEGSYGYVTNCPDLSQRGQWIDVVLENMPPPAREPGDRLICYVWHRAASPIFIDDLKLDVYVVK